MEQRLSEEGIDCDLVEGDGYILILQLFRKVGVANERMPLYPFQSNGRSLKWQDVLCLIRTSVRILSLKDIDLFSGIVFSGIFF